MPHCEITVPVAEPAMPRPTPYTSSRLSSRLTEKPVTATSSGVRVSCSPRSTPVAARTPSIAGIPRELIRR